jgi:pyruvate dehydrogenase E1 component
VNEDGMKVGGHQASSASLATIMTALYGHSLHAQDRVAVKPHASPNFHALQYLFGHQSLDKLQNFRGFRGAQSYPSRTKDVDDVDFSTGSVGLGVAQTLFSSLVQDYLAAKNWPGQAPTLPLGKMVSLIGDAELDEGNIYEALVEGWKHSIRNVWWVIDYNRQSLDAVVHEDLWQRVEGIFKNFGWDVVVLKYGHLQEQAFGEPGGAALKAWIDTCPNQLYAALCFQGGAAWRKRLLDEIGDQGPASALIARRSDAELASLMTNLGGHDLPALIDAFDQARTHDRPVCFLCYTVKGMGLPLQGHKDNHAGLLTPAQMDKWRAAMNIRLGHEWDKFEGLAWDADRMQAALDAVPFIQRGTRRYHAPKLAVPARLNLPQQTQLSTQQGFGLIMNDLARLDLPLVDRIVTTSPDVTVSTNLGGWVNRRKLFARDPRPDLFKKEMIPSTFAWEFSPQGQHIELGIAEMNLFILLSALGLSHSIHGTRLIPIGTLYDPFIYRGADALNYACYQDARFILVATPSGITLAPEGGAHQSIGTPLIGMAQDGLAAFEPAFVDELEIILRFAFEYVQRDGTKDRAGANWLRDHTGGSIYLRLSTRSLEKIPRAMDPTFERNVIDGAYWLRPPGPNCELVVAYTGAIAPEAMEAVGSLAGLRRDIALMAVTSADRLHAGWSAAALAREAGDHHARSHIEAMLDLIPRHAGIISVCDSHPATLSWLGGVNGHRIRALGVEHFGQTGTIADLYRHYGIDADAIRKAAFGLEPRWRRD